MAGIKDITPERLAALNSGAEATNLTECLAVNFRTLMETIAPNIKIDAQSIDLKSGISVRMRQAGAILAAGGTDRIARFANHPSDTARGWAAFASVAGIGLNDTLKAIRPFADDPHFGVREWAWMAANRGHLYLHGEMKLWDLAAGTLILAEAGGYACTLQGESVFRTGMAVRSVVASPDRALFEAWFAYLQENQ